MQRAIIIAFPVKKKNQDDTYKLMANFFESDAGSCFILGETNRSQRQRHNVTEGCIIEDVVTDKAYRCSVHWAISANFYEHHPY